MRRALAAVALLALSPAFGDIEKGVEAYEAGNYKQALSHFQEAAERSNDPRALFWLGEMCSRARGVPLDFRRAAEWWQRAADKGEARAQHGLGLLYRSGTGVRIDEQAGLAWLEKAAEQGHLDAQADLAGIYAEDNEYARALTWALVAAMRGRPGDRDTRDEIAALATDKETQFGSSLASKWMKRHSAGAKVSDLLRDGFAVYTLAQQKGNRPALLDLLQHEDEQVRARSSAALAPDTDALPEILALLESKNTLARWGAVSALREMGSKEALKPLLGMLHDDDARVRIETVKALGAIGPAAKDAIPTLVGVLRLVGSRSGEAAGVALLRIGPASGPALVDLLEADSAALQTKVAFILGRLKAVPDKAVPALLTLALRDGSMNVQFAALKALREYAKDSFDPILDRLDAKSPLDRARSLEVLYLIGVDAPDAVPIVVAQLQDKNATVRRNAAQALGRIGVSHKATVPALKRVMANDKDRVVRNNAIIALGELAPKSPEALAALGATLFDPRAQMRASAASMLGHKRMRLVATQAVPHLVVALKDSDWPVVANATMGIAQLGPAAKDAIPALNALRRREGVPDWIRAEVEIALETLQTQGQHR
jgi:HEAT repeat protein